ncbi:IS256 family transposase [Cuniculiplasma divulgatum]|uniref:IS256 family transposase n=1 Tax=Cuniculiplasma divulgatum TaxID=1673428 RepID=A0A1N5UM52_9ARCH|nr:IS256 family transposase [Cuniculiplasma divulgatum]SIM61696.1 IS256 family transposase [Cuniculiplasma divulgatum]
MQDQMEMVKEVISTFLNDRKEGKKQLVEWFLNKVMEEEARIQVSAEPYERSEERKAHRNGTRKRKLNTTDGTVELDKPQIREFPFETKVFDRYSRVEKALDSVMLESYLHGVSTRNVMNVVRSLGMENVSASYVSSLASGLDANVKTFLERPIESPMKFMYIDATYFKIREDGRYSNKALYVCIGINSEGKREILSARLHDSETEMQWEAFFDNLKERGLKGVELVVSDGHRGIMEAVSRSFLGASWQYCHVHFLRNLMKVIPKKKWQSVSLIVKEALENESLISRAQDVLVANGLEGASDMFERWHPSLYNYLAFDPNCWRRLRTTNVLERLNLEFKRRTRKIGAFPSEQSLMRLVVSIMMDINEEWITGRKYISMEGN